MNEDSENETTEDPKDEEDENSLECIREKYSVAEEYWKDNRRDAVDDIKFSAGEQWPDNIASQRATDKRPMLVVDKLNQYVRQIVNDGRQNRPSIKVRPVDSGADILTANIFQGIVKHIESSSNADSAYDHALANAATSGFGFFRVVSEYAGENTFDQELRIKRVRNPLSVITDPSMMEADGSDMNFAFVVESIPKKEFEKEWPDKIPEDFETNESYSDWYGDEVRIAEYWCVKKEKRTLHLLLDGSVISMAEYDQMKESGIDIDSMVKESRNIPKRTVMRAKISGKDFLEPLTEWPGKYIPILVVLGNEIDVEGKVILSGIIRPAKDAQRLYNYSRSSFAERVALTPKAPWVAAEGQVEDYEEEWNSANTKNHSVLRYKPISLNGQPIPPPQRTQASDIPAGFAQDMQLSEHDIQGAIGMYSSSLGAPSNERSGKAIMARQKEGDVGTFHYHDNLNRAISHLGRILVDLIPHFYDSKRVTRIIGFDGKTDNVQLDPSSPTASKKMGVNTIYNLGVGTYDVSVSAGPSYNTLRQEAADSIDRMIQANPNLMAIIGDLLVKNMDWPGADEISDRLKLALDPKVLEAENQKKEMTPEMQQMKSAFEQQMQEKDQLMEQAAQAIEQLKEEAKKAMEESKAKHDEIQIKAAETEIKAYAAETDRLAAVASSFTPEQIQTIVIQTLQDLMTSNAPEVSQEPVNGIPEQMPDSPPMEPQNGY